MLERSTSVNIYTNHRQVYKEHYGPIPKDINGRSYDIHHIDGDHTNNDPTNLKAVTIQEHYNIHYTQGEYNACFKMAWRMRMSPTELSELARKSALQRVAAGTHPWAGDNSISKRKSKDGTHHWLGKNNPIVKATLEGKNPAHRSKVCIHCSRSIPMNNYHRWHGDNCKQKFNK